MGEGNKEHDKVFIFLSAFIVLEYIVTMVMNFFAGGAGVSIGKY